jgi:DNA-directed RNA polymerase subunit RPC12/RpoP
MPIRFRCSYCNQLLGISRRKSGTSVRCPTCAGQVLVPEQDESSTVPGREDPNPFVFDRNDFDGLLQGEVAASVAPEPVAANGADPRVLPAVGAPAGAWGTHAEPSYRERMPVAKPAQQNGQIVRPSPGLYLSRKQLIVAGVVAAVAIVIAFGIGLTIGIMLGAPEKNAASLSFPRLTSAKSYV